MKLKNRVENFRKKLKKDFNSKKYQGCEGDIRKVWSVSKEILFGSPARDCSIDKIVSADSRLITETKAIANEFNLYFTSIGEELAKKLSIENHNLPFEDTMSYDNPNSVSFYPALECAGFDKITADF